MQAKPKKAEDENAESKPGFGAYATTAMFVGLCASYIGSYIGKVFAPNDGDLMPLIVAAIAGLCMAVFEYFTQKKDMKVLDNFSLAASMLIAMGWSLKDVQEWLGHADIQMTANIYSHLDIARKTSIAASLADKFGADSGR